VFGWHVKAYSFSKATMQHIQIRGSMAIWSSVAPGPVATMFIRPSLQLSSSHSQLIMPTVRNSATARILADIPYPTDSVRRNATRVAAKKSEQRVNALVCTHRVKAEDIEGVDLKQGVFLIRSWSVCPNTS